MRLIDTDVAIDVLRRHPPAVQWFYGLRALPGVPGFVVMELIQGAQNAKQLQAVLTFAEPLKIVWATPEQCDHAVELFKRFRLAQGIDLLDALIAACAIGGSAQLYSFNLKAFQRYSGLKGRGAVHALSLSRQCSLPPILILLQPVPHPAYGVDQIRCVAEFFADGGDVHVDGAVGDEHVVAHRFVHQLIAG